MTLEPPFATQAEIPLLERADARRAELAQLEKDRAARAAAAEADRLAALPRTTREILAARAEDGVVTTASRLVKRWAAKANPFTPLTRVLRGL